MRKAIKPLTHIFTEVKKEVELEPIKPALNIDAK